MTMDPSLKPSRLFPDLPGMLPEPLFTPTTKAEVGHDQPVTFQELVDSVGQELSEQLRDLSLMIYGVAERFARSKGLLLADTKFEFGWIDDRLALIDEALVLVSELRDQSAKKVAASPDEQQQALELRNRLAALLYERMQLVRSAARYVYRHDASRIRRVTSAYQRQRIARYRKQRQQQTEASVPTAQEQAPIE